MNGDNMDCKMCGGKVEGEIIRAVGLVFHSGSSINYVDFKGKFKM